MIGGLCACGCGASLAGLRSDAVFYSEACKKRCQRARSRDRAGTRGLTDRDRVLAALRAAGPQGLHSHDVRRRGLSGHPSERAKELEERGYTIRREREYRDGRNGTRFYLLSEPTVGLGGGSVEASMSCASAAGHSPQPGGADARPNTGTPPSKGSGRSDKPEPVPSAGVDGGSPEGSSQSPSGDAAVRLFEPEPERPSVPSAYDPWEGEAAA